MTAAAEPDNRHRRFIPSARTNLPVWPKTPPPIDARGRSFVLVGVGSNSDPILAGWRTAIDATGLPCRIRDHKSEPTVEDAPATWLETVLATARIGCRLMLAGPEGDVLLLSALARRAGLLEAEIRAHRVADGEVRCHCVHCKTTFRCEGEPGSVVPCSGCGRLLLVHQHLSRRIAAHVGFVADIEKPR